MFLSSRVKMFISIAKLDDRCFCYVTAAMFVSLRRTQTWRLHTKLYKFGWHISANSAWMKNSRGLILGEVVYIAIIYHIPDFWIYLLRGYDFSFDYTTVENREYNLRFEILDLRRTKLFNKSGSDSVLGAVNRAFAPTMVEGLIRLFFDRVSIDARRRGTCTFALRMFNQVKTGWKTELGMLIDIECEESFTPQDVYSCIL